MRALLGIAVVGFGAGLARSGVGVETHAFTFTGLGAAGGGTGGPWIVAMPGFDTHAGVRTLERIDLELVTRTELRSDFENPNPEPWTIDNVHASYATSVALTAGASMQTPGFGMDSGAIDLAPADPVPNAGDDFASFGVDGYELIGRASFHESWVLGAFASGDPGLAIVDAASVVLLTGAGDTLSGTSFSQSGELRVSFVFTSIPEPGAGIAVACAALCVNARRRR